MKRISISIVLIMLLIQGCKPRPETNQPEVTATKFPTTEITSTVETIKKSVVLISWDASRADTIYGLMDQGLLPTFSSFAAGGVRAEYAQTIDPPLTAVAHNSISSGSYPTRTGITSNSFHVIGDDFYWYRKGFEEPMDKAEPIWVTASRNGLTTAAVFFPGGTPSLGNQMADYTIGYGSQDAYSNQVKVALSNAAGWEDTPESFNTPLTGSFTIQNVGTIFLYVIDSTNDSAINYDKVVLNTEMKGILPAVTLGIADWGSLVLLKRAFAGADFLVQEITPETVTLYHTGVTRNTASPADLLKALNDKFGFFPAGGDYYALENGWISEENFIYQIEKQSLYSANVAAWVYSTYHPDLMLTWQDPFDAAGHQFFMTDPRQLNYSPEVAEKYRRYYLQAAEIADHALSIMLKAFDLKKTTVLMVGDHGMAPIHSSLFVNTVLEQAGLLTLDSQNSVVLNQTKAFAIASGGAVHIYINLVGREKGGGTVSVEDFPEVQKQIIGIFSKLTDPETGELVFQRVLAHSELEPLGLNHPNSGDVFAQANPGYQLDGWRGNDAVFAQADFYGQHGYDSTLPEMHAIFIAGGAGVKKSGELLPPIRVVDIAPTIAWLLSFSPADTVDGSPIPALVNP